MSLRQTIRVGTRGSRLALLQTETVIAALRAVSPQTDFVVQHIRSAGDQQPDASLESLGYGAFTKTIEDALLDGRIDLAVHSLKDLPIEQPNGLTVVVVLPREDPRDVLIDHWKVSLIDLPEGARIGTSSPRRAAQLKHGRRDIELLPIRGNVETRLAKAEGPDYDGVILAAAGLKRLGLGAKITEYLSPHVCAPAPGQAALAAEARTDDMDVVALLHRIVNRPTARAVEAERAVLRAASAGCHTAIGAYARVDNGRLRLFATVTPADGSVSYRVEVNGSDEDPEIAGKAAYLELIQQGAGALLEGEAA